MIIEIDLYLNFISFNLIIFGGLLFQVFLHLVEFFMYVSIKGVEITVTVCRILYISLL